MYFAILKEIDRYVNWTIFNNQWQECYLFPWKYPPILKMCIRYFIQEMQRHTFVTTPKKSTFQKTLYAYTSFFYYKICKV